MRVLTFTVPKEWEQSKLKVFLRGYCNLSARLLTKQKRVKMGLTINGKHGRANDLLKTGDVVCVNLPDIEKDIEAVPLPLSIVYEDDDIIVINKAWSMPIYPTAGHDRDSLANALFYHYQTKGMKLGFHPVYRLDKDTSGLIVIAKHGYAAAILSKSIEKEYTAICEGVLQGQGTIDAPIRLKEGYTARNCSGWSACSYPLESDWCHQSTYFAANSPGNRANTSDSCSFFPHRSSSCR